MKNEIENIGFPVVGELMDLDTVPARKGGKLCLGLECLERNQWELYPALDEIAKLGVFSARIQSGWARMEKEEGKYDFSALDREVDSLLSLDVQPWLCLCYGNPLYYSGNPEELKPGGLGHIPVKTDRERNAWVRYVEATVRHFKGRIRRYEIWNEPDVVIFFPSKGYWADDYMELVRLTSPAIRSADPDAKVISCTGNLNSLNPLLEMGLGNYVDQHTFHNYRPLPELLSMATRTTLRALCDRYAPHIELIRGEAGCPSYNDPKSRGALHFMKNTELIQAKWMSRHLIADLGDPGLIETSYFHIYDYLYYTWTHRYYYGILREDYSRKLSYYVFQVLSHLFDADASIDQKNCLVFDEWRDGENIAADEITKIFTFAFQRNERPIFAYWLAETVRDDVSVHCAKTRCLPIQKWKNPVILDTLTRKIHIPTAIGDNNRLLLPVTGHALILTEAETFYDWLNTDAQIRLTEFEWIGINGQVRQQQHE